MWTCWRSGRSTPLPADCAASTARWLGVHQHAASHLPCRSAFTHACTHPKFIHLRNYLQRYQDADQFHCIIFACTRASVRALAELLAFCPQLRFIQASVRPAGLR